MQTSFNLVNTSAVLQKQWKTLLAFTLVTTLAAALTVNLVPKYFRSSATIVSANPALADKARLFNNNIQGLYSYFGTGDDLDRISGIADMDTTYKKLVNEFSLVSYYKLDGDSIPLLKRKAVLQLRKDLGFQKTEQGQLKIIAWTKDRELSARLVNRTVAIIKEIESGIWEQNYVQSLAKLNASIADMERRYQTLSDSVGLMNSGKRELAVTQMQTLLEQLKQYRKSADEFTLAKETNPAVLYVLEAGVPAVKAERPDKINIIIAAMIVGFVFSSILVLVNDRKLIN